MSKQTKPNYKDDCELPSPEKEGGRGGRPKLLIIKVPDEENGGTKQVPDPEVLKEISIMASRNLNMGQIAYALKVHYDTFNERCKEFPEFSESFDSGRSLGVLEISNSLYKSAKGGHFLSKKLYLENASKEFRRRREVDLKSTDGSMSPTIDAKKLSDGALKEIMDASTKEADESDDK